MRGFQIATKHLPTLFKNSAHNDNSFRFMYDFHKDKSTQFDIK